ncbi:MAG: adenylate/guanylate cyclase domain-containing protein [Deltaproteobacteria bacterium]|nr:adenylate/guanylate cyclase domain-containing protein [Deltaproteobacteria bacterium]
MTTDDLQELGILRTKLSQARALLELNARVDDLIEGCLQERQSLADALGHVLPALCQAVGGRGAFLRSFSEDLALTTFVHPLDLSRADMDEALKRTEVGGGPCVLHSEGQVIVAQPLDVGGEWFGHAGVILPANSPYFSDHEHVAEALNVVCEEVDNFLYAIRATRERHRVMMDLGDALRHRVLSEGLRAAVTVLAKAVPLERLLLVCVAEEQSSRSVHVQLFNGGALEVDTMSEGPAARDDVALRDMARSYLVDGDIALLGHLGFANVQEEVLINGVTVTNIVGKIVATSTVGAFNTYDRELLAGFAGFIRQRIVDFNKEWRTLARSFCSEDVARLLSFGDYTARYLAPREEEVGILFTDIAGFTMLSEQVLRSPSAVATLVEAWSRRAVDLVWKHGGVFDKMVGDCVIALFGPPFFDMPSSERIASAIACARDIRAMTTALPDELDLAGLRDAGLAVSTGVHLAPLFVGQFGPNDNFTGFSSGMNNTARLQGCAGRDEILVMREATQKLKPDHDFRFGPVREAKVKNVAEALQFVALI